MHARMPKNFVLDQRIGRASRAIETNAQAYRGYWEEACYPLGNGTGNRYSRVHLDLGCGKGTYIVEMAKAHPDTLFIGIDSEPVCVVHAAQRVLDCDVANAVVVPADVSKLTHIFAPGELNCITINFPTPHPKRRHAKLRLTAAQQLAIYQPLLASGASVILRTDSRPLYEFSLRQFETLGWNITCATTNDRQEHPKQPITEYEERLTVQGATVNAIYAEPPKASTTPEQIETANALPQSLIDYLPDNLFEAEYIPYGMSYAIENMRNRRRNEAAKRAAESE